jgi:Undecaprenyl-phosphate glucose phosphotransferase
MSNRYRFFLSFLLWITDFGLVFLSVYVFLTPSVRAEMWADWLSFENGLYVSMQTWFIAAMYHRMYRNFVIQGLPGLYRASWRVLLTQQILYITYLNLNPSVIKGAELIQQAVFTATFLLTVGLISRILLTLLSRYYEKKFGQQNSVAIWGFNQTGIELAAQLETHASDKKFMGIMDENQSFDFTQKKDLHVRLREAIKLASVQKIRELFICVNPQMFQDVKGLFTLADEYCLRIKFVPDILGQYPDNAVLHHVHQFQAISLRDEPLEDQDNRFAKRFFDVFFSLLVIIFILSWLYPIIGLIIKLQSPGPIIFRQLRSGENNVPFWCYKFRSMRVNSESDTMQATKNDQRVTKFGQFIRKTSLDELPQFFNVLIGDMSVVGPRPHMLNHTKEYNAITENFMVRHFVKPGITGLAQIRGLRGEITDMKYIQERINMDIEYLENWNLIADIKICFLTFYFIVKGDENVF